MKKRRLVIPSSGKRMSVALTAFLICAFSGCCVEVDMAVIVAEDAARWWTEVTTMRKMLTRKRRFT
jgi:hypothetical protein